MSLFTPFVKILIILTVFWFIQSIVVKVLDNKKELEISRIEAESQKQIIDHIRYLEEERSKREDIILDILNRHSQDLNS